MKNLDLDIANDTRAESIDYIRGTQTCSGKYSRIDRTVEYMAKNIDKPLPVSKLANLAGASLSHFFSLFKQRMGYSPIDYFTRMRMWRACALLDSTAARVKEVAVAVGYEDAFYFSRVFKSRSAVAPTRYRRLGQELRLEIKERLKADGMRAPDLAFHASTLLRERPVGIGKTMCGRYQ